MYKSYNWAAAGEAKIRTRPKSHSSHNLQIHTCPKPERHTAKPTSEKKEPERGEVLLLNQPLPSAHPYSFG